VSWDELGPGLHSDRFTIRDLPARLEGLKRDPWASYFEVRQRLTAAVLREFRTP
jgi:DNA primase